MKYRKGEWRERYSRRVDQATSGYTLPLTCARCGGDAGRFLQWPQQPEGVGICRACADEMLAAGTDPGDLREQFGVPGKHHQAYHFWTMGRAFKVLAVFPNTPEGEDASYRYTMKHPDSRILSWHDDRIILASSRDAGQSDSPVTRALLPVLPH